MDERLDKVDIAKCKMNNEKKDTQSESFEYSVGESNQGHKDFQSFALPTELWHHSVFSNVVLFGAAKIAFFIK